MPGADLNDRVAFLAVARERSFTHLARRQHGTGEQRADRLPRRHPEERWQNDCAGL